MSILKRTKNGFHRFSRKTKKGIFPYDNEITITLAFTGNHINLLSMGSW